MMKKLLQVTYILVMNYLTNCLDKKVKIVNEIAKLGIDGPKNGQTAEKWPRPNW